MKNKLRRARLVIRHALAMWRVLNLPKNIAKGGWAGMDVRDLLRLAEIEMEELRTECWFHSLGHSTARQVENEAGDLSAFAAMIADVTRRK